MFRVSLQRAFAGIGPLCGVLLFHEPTAATEAFRLQLPINCTVGRDCFIQNFVDVDKGPGAADYMCGTLTYDGHKGTDFRIPDLPTAKSVAVLAAADGQVLRVRDGMEDISSRTNAAKSHVGKECGNGVVVRHVEEWQTQYCHLAKGSVIVKPGDRIRAGQAIGRVGLSGHSEFSHLHFSVSHGGRVADPFAANVAHTCGETDLLWASDLETELRYTPTFVINRGFLTQADQRHQIEYGILREFVFSDDIPALIAAVRVGGLLKGDVQEFALYGPDGERLVGRTNDPLPSQFADYTWIIGKRRPESGWKDGSYRAEYRVLRDGVEITAVTFSTTR